MRKGIHNIDNKMRPSYRAERERIGINQRQRGTIVRHAQKRNTVTIRPCVK